MDYVSAVLLALAILAMFITFNQWTRCAGRQFCVTPKILRNYFIGMTLGFASFLALAAHLIWGI